METTTPIQSATEILERETGVSPSKTLKSSTEVTDSTTNETPKKPVRKWRQIRRKKRGTASTDIGKIEGVMRMTISPWVQKVLHCLIGEEVTAEYPWKYVKKEDLEDNLELHEESSEFLPFKEQIVVFPQAQMLIIYIPDEQRDYDEFYICLTESAEKGALVIINRILEEREERLNNSILKTIGKWETLGSESEVKDLQMDNKNRPLLEVEIETDYPLKPTKIRFRFRMVDQARDGYAEIITTRKTFQNLVRKRQDIAVQVARTTVDNGSQTEYYVNNANTQYDFKFPKLLEPGKQFEKNLKDFLDNDMERLEHVLFTNAHIDFYRDDYVALVRDEKYTTIPMSMYFKPYASFLHPSSSHGKEIICHSWHPLWTGIIAIGYGKYKLGASRTCDRTEDLVNNVVHNTTPILLWSFKDILVPSLYLETCREIHSLSWCPYDENILVGGCVNGQVIVWDITDKLQTAEKEEILTVAQKGHRKYLKKFTVWMKNTLDLKRVLPTVISDLEYSHKGAVTGIRWIPRLREVTRSGQIKDIPEEEERGSMQFTTCSLDGVLLTWDLLFSPSGHASVYRPQRKSRRLTSRPSALTVTVSKYRYLNRIFRPIYKVNVIYPNSSRMLPLTEINMRVATTKYVEKYPDPTRKFKITDRLIYYPIFKQPTFPCINELVAGSLEGDFLILSWEGFDYNSGEIINKENAKFDNIARYHDGPMRSISISEVFSDLILTVGGKIFALWHKNLKGKPIMWKRSKIKYSYGAWNIFRPSTFRLCRVDGFIETWHLKTRSDCHTSIQLLSTPGLGMATHHLRPMKQNIVGMVASKGSFELFYLSHNLSLATEEDKWSTYKICERERNRKEQFIKWQNDWLKKHEQQIKERQDQARMLKLEKEEALKLERAQMRAEQEKLKEQIDENEPGPPPGQYAEWAEQKQRERDKNRMIDEVLRQKHLNIKELKENEKPLHAIAAEHLQKQLKLEQRQNISQRLFDETVGILFPDVIKEEVPPIPDPYAGGDSIEVKMQHFESYTKILEEYDTYVKERQYKFNFDWLTLLQTVKQRRRNCEMHTNRYSHRQRKLREKLAKENEASGTIKQTTTYQEPSRTSSESIEYEINTSEPSAAAEENSDA